MRLQEIQIELAGLCNATCNYCTWQKRSVGKQMMRTSLAMRLLDEAAELGVGVIRYHGLGESMLHPDIAGIIAAGEQHGFDHSISTNCYNLSKDKAEALKPHANLSVILAVPWVMKKTFVDKCIFNALKYLEGNSNRRVHVQMVCHEKAEKYYRRLVDTFLSTIEKTPNAWLHLKQPVTWPNDTPNQGFINVELLNHPKVIHDSRLTPLSIGKGCTMPDRFLMVMADGTCVPCCVGMDDWGLGRIGNRSLKEVWESAEMSRIREQWRSLSDEIPCGKCKKRKDCLQ